METRCNFTETSYCSYNKIVALDCISYIILQFTSLPMAHILSLNIPVYTLSLKFLQLNFKSSPPILEVPSSHHVSTALLVCIPHVLTFSRSLTLQSLLCSSSKAVTGYKPFGPHHTGRKYTETAHVLCSETPIRQPSLEISPLWFPLIGKEINCYLG